MSGRFMQACLLAVAVGATGVPATAAANQAPATEVADTGWKGSVELGLAVSRGNTDSQILRSRLGLARSDERGKHEVGLSFLYGEQDGVESAYRYEAFGRSNRRLGEHHEIFASARTERDHVAAYEYQSTIAFGYGNQVSRSEATQLGFEIGPGYKWSKLQDVRVHENGVVVRGNMDFNHQFNASTSLYDTLLVEAGVTNTFARNDIGVRVKMSESMALRAGVEVRHNTDVLPTRDKTDTVTTVNVTYGF
jgi:putative salt-induced outer membrane protein